MQPCKNLLFLADMITKKFLRYSSRTKQKEYGKALAFYLVYNDSYLTMEGINLNLLSFMVKIAQNNFIFSKNQISHITTEEIEEYFSE